jgi:hypothetical protein
MTTNTISEPLPISRFAKRRSVELQDKVALLLLTFGAPGNERTVRNKDSVLRTNADTSQLHVGKRLLECDEYRAISIHDGHIRDYVARIALPSPFKAGTYVIPVSMLNIVDDKLTSLAVERAALVDQFIDVYEQAKTVARSKLGELYNEGDYLTPAGLRSAYRLVWQYVTLAPPESMRSLNAEIFERERERLQAQWDDAIDTMRDALRAGMQELVDDLVGRLSDGDRKFKPTKLLDRFNEFLTTFDARNVTDDADLAELAAQARQLLAGVDSENIKQADVKTQILDGFKTAKAKLDELETVAKKQRRISFEDD